jgi:molecular chaperone GrpE (heat shock protein)
MTKSSCSSNDNDNDNNNDKEEEDPIFATLYQGIVLTHQELLKAFGKNGLTQYCITPGDVFNPEEHEALLQYPVPVTTTTDNNNSNNSNDNTTKKTVGQIIKFGYKLNCRVIRSAQVGVAIPTTPK